MCGISVILDFSASHHLHATIFRMHAQIPHRGPDGEGFLFVDTSDRTYTSRAAAAVTLPENQSFRLGMGFRWLKIQDPDEAAAQPMGSQDRTVWLLLNGEIYNFLELRTTLQKHGCVFTTQSDTEVVLAAYQTWGTDCFRRFCGMWALVLVDLRAQKVIVSRDRFGIKPLFYCFDGTRLLFASEIKQLVAAVRQPVSANLRVVCEFLHGRHLHHGEETFFDGILALHPATYADISLVSLPAAPLTCTPYWHSHDFVCAEPHRTVSFTEACAAFDDLLRMVVAEHLTAQVPVGSLLSGGLDSSTLTALLAEYSAFHQNPPSSFSLVFPDYPAFDESPHIVAVAEHCRLHNVKTTLDTAWVQENMPRIARTQEEPLIGLAWLAQYWIYQCAAEHGVRVILDGQGADEILAGYPRHQEILLRHELRQWHLWTCFREAAALMHREPATWRQLARRALAGLLGHRLQQRVSRPAADWLSPSGKEFLRQTSGDLAGPLLNREPSWLNRALHADVQHGNLKTVLAVGDRNSMAHSVESRVPYLDHRIVEFAFQLPATYKAGSGLRKRLLRQVASRYLPTSVVHRRDRIGFGTPQQAWLKDYYREGVYEALASTVFRSTPFIDRERLITGVNDFYAGHHGDGAAIWRVYALWQWAEAYRMSLA